MQQPDFSSIWSVQKVLKQISIAADVLVCNTLWHNKGNPNGKKGLMALNFIIKEKQWNEKSKKVDLHKEQQFKLS